ncbi:MAG: glycosyltransferase family 4 protein [Luteolibacter sp.]
MKIVQITTDSREHYRTYGSGVPAFGAAPEALLEGFSGLPNVEIHVLSCLRQPVESPSKLAENIHYHALTVGRKGWMSSAYTGCILKTRKWMGELQPDLVHGQGTEKECAMCAVHSGYPNVVTIHGNMAELHRLGFQGHRLFGTIASVLEGHALARTRGVFCNSAYTESLVKPRARRTWRVPNPIREAFFRPATGTPAEDTPMILNVGLVTPRKRQLELLRALRDLAQDGHAFKIVFAGGLSENTEYGRQFAMELRSAEKEGIAEFAGFLDADQLIALMDRCSGFVHYPSEEAFGLVVAEAMARGLKFFGADLGGIRDIAEGIPSAEAHESMPSLSAGIANWLQAGAPRQPEAADEIARRYHPKIIAARHLQIYREVLERQ